MKASVDFTVLLDTIVVQKVRFDRTKGEAVVLQSPEGGLILELNHYEKDSLFNTVYSVCEALDHLAFKVDDLDRSLKEAGHRVLMEMGINNARWFYVEDPNGIWIELF